ALNDADALITQLEKLIAKKRLIKQGAMQQLLKPKPGWQTKKFGEIAEFFSGGTPSTSVPSYYGGNIAWITSSDLNKGKIYDVENRITEEGLNNSAARMIKKDTLLLALYGATAGVTAISYIDAAINQAVLAIIPTSANKLYLFYKLSSIKSWLVNTFTQGGQANLSGRIIKSIELPFPCVEEQNRIAQILSDMDVELDALEARLAKYKQIKQGMMQTLLTGKVRVL
ncbi:MAG: restriction endonuclease subunit S, partial [Candidatus Riflebacteria bacterium]|nr:restriction endonuclease subunit S [Candidatus Riflebacteria bacterium]